MKFPSLILITFALVICATSCSKEQGCRDTLAYNYSNSAEEEDGSCLYEAKADFYYDFGSKQDFEEDGITQLAVYVDGELAGLLDADLSLTPAVACNSNNNITKTFDLGSRTTAAYNLAVRDQYGFLIYSQEFTVTGGRCKNVKIDYSN
jgi:hypothetical protein